MKNSKIILSKNVKMDKNYVNILDYTTNTMIAMLTDEVHFLARADDFSFIRNNGRISVPFNMFICKESNYIAFKNPDYENKWFFAWVDNVVYKSDSCCELEYTVDVMSTWWEQWTAATCFVEREHIANDYIGASTTNEPLSVGDYVANNVYGLSVTPNKICFLFSEVRKSEGTYVSPKEAYDDAGLSIPFIGNLPMTLWRVTADLTQSGVSTLMAYFSDYVKDGKSGDLVGIFTYNSNTDINTGLTRGKQISLDGYTPKYSKCLQYPFVKITLSNNAGSSVDLRQEDFGDNIIFEYANTANYKGQSICYPVGYKGVERNTDNGLIIDNFPTIPMTVDSFATYLAQNSTNIALAATSGAIGTVASVASGNPLAGVAGVGSLLNQINQISVAKTKPDTITGLANGNLINMLLDKFVFNIEINTCKSDVAKSIDSFFDKYGYAVNQIKTPNLSGNSHNYVKISDDSVIGYGSVPAEYMETINKAFRRGVTIWHNEGQLGFY